MMRQYAITDLDTFDSREWSSNGQRRRVCPGCGETKKQDKEHACFVYDPDSGKYDCKRCGLKGTLVDYWETIARCPYCDLLREDFQRAAIWKGWKEKGRKPEDREKTKDEADKVLGLQVTDAGAWNCRGCNASGQLRNYIGQGTARQANYTVRKNQEKAREKMVATIDALTNGAPAATDAEDNCKWLEIWEDSLPLDWAGGLEYFNSRGIHHDGRAANVRWHEAWGRTEKWAGHPALLFPVTDRRGNLVAISGRFIDPPDWLQPHRTYGAKSQGVFVTSPGVWKAEQVAITEAPIDALAYEEMWHIPAIALIGTSWPDWLAPAMVFKTVSFASDADDAGDNLATNLTVELKPYAREIERARPPLKDWGKVAESTPAPTPKAEPIKTEIIADLPASAARLAKLGSIARPVTVQARLLNGCPYGTCGGEVRGAKDGLYQCATCGSWFKLTPPDPDVVACVASVARGQALKAAGDAKLITVADLYRAAERRERESASPEVDEDGDVLPPENEENG
jgi:hypothetical protein